MHWAVLNPSCTPEMLSQLVEIGFSLKLLTKKKKLSLLSIHLEISSANINYGVVKYLIEHRDTDLRALRKEDFDKIKD